MEKTDVRQKIIAAAVKIFAQKGFFETTVDDIARSVKIAKGTVYLYFKDKPSLYLGIIEQHFSLAVSSLEEIRGMNLSCIEQLQMITDTWLEYMFKFKHEFPMFGMENVNLTRRIMKGIRPILFVRLRAIIDQVTGIIKTGIKNGEFRAIDPQLGAIYFLNVIRTAFLIRNLPIKFKKSKKGVMNMFLLGLKKEKK
jgi:TetR/AcrR family fatty acid metabolism transcriptional regulator